MDEFYQISSKNSWPWPFYPPFQCLNSSLYLYHFAPYAQDSSPDLLHLFQLSERPRMWDYACFCYKNELALSFYLTRPWTVFKLNFLFRKMTFVVHIYPICIVSAWPHPLSQLNKKIIQRPRACNAECLTHLWFLRTICQSIECNDASAIVKSKQTPEGVEVAPIIWYSPKV